MLACVIVTLLGEKLKTIGEIGIHWLTAIKNMLNKIIRKLNFLKKELCQTLLVFKRV